MAFVGNDTATHIDPTARHARHVQKLGNDRGREQLSVADNAVVPHLGILDLDLSLRSDLFQFGKQLIDRLQTVGCTQQFADHLAVVTPECRDMLHRQGAITRLHTLENTFESIGGLTHCRRSGRSVEVDTCVLMAFVGNDTATHIDPTARHARHVQKLGNDRGREQLSVADNAVVPHLGILDLDLSLRSDLFQFGKQLIDRLQTVGCTQQFADHLAVVTPECRDMLHRQGAITRLHTLENTFESIGGLTHCRHDDEQLALVLHNGTQITDTVSRRDRSSAEFVNFHL